MANRKDLLRPCFLDLLDLTALAWTTSTATKNSKKPESLMSFVNWQVSCGSETTDAWTTLSPFHIFPTVLNVSHVFFFGSMSNGMKIVLGSIRPSCQPN